MLAVSPKSLFRVRILCPKTPRNPHVAAEEKTDFDRIPNNTYYYVYTAPAGSIFLPA